MSVISEVIGYCTEDGADKEYRIHVRKDNGGAYNVTGYYGRRGRATNEYDGGRFASLTDAIEAAKKLRKKKEKGHYHFSDGKGEVISTIPKEKSDTGWRPMLQTAISQARAQELVEDSNFFAQKKYDGEHLIASKAVDDTVTFANKLGFATTVPAYLEKAMKDGPYITVSGELLNDCYVVFDLLEMSGTDVRSKTYAERLNFLEIFKDVLGPGIYIAPTARTEEEKQELMDTVEAEHGEGWIFKDKNASYTEGRKHGKQFKCKRWKSATCIVLGHNKSVRSIRLGVWVNDDHSPTEVYVGDVTVKANQLVPSVGSFVEVKYLDYKAGGKLTQPELLRERTDVTNLDCLITQLQGLVPDKIVPQEKVMEA